MDLSFALSIHAMPTGEAASPENDCEDERVIGIRDDGSVLLGVMDGCGGTGSKRYPKAGNWTGAKIAAHEVGYAVYEWFHSLDPQTLRKASAEDLGEDLRAVLEKHLASVKQEVESDSESTLMIITGLTRDLPTTLAVMTVEQDQKKLLRVRSYWAGNARNYVFTPEGLFQFSMDDLVRDYDPYEDLTQDGILSNSVNASGPFEIHNNETVLSGPVILFSATDGVFSYFDSPIRMEWILLETLQKAGSPAEWEALLREEIDSYSSDDHAMQMLAIGFDSFPAVKELFTNRTKKLFEEYVERLNTAYEKNDHAEQQRLWLKYKDSYMKL